MRTLVGILAVLSIFAGLYFLATAIATPYLYKTTDWSAIQMTQLYSMATYNAAVAAACFVFAGLCVITARGMAAEAQIHAGPRLN